MVLKGKYRHYCAIQAATRTSDSQGGFVPTWADVSNEWFRVVPLNGSRTLDNGGVTYRYAAEFYANKFSAAYTITEANRIVWNSQNYTIHSIVPSEKLDEIKILAYA
jgi:SPP1 family predicted phage head-tail adaptor